MNPRGLHFLVLGLGESGLAMARWLARCGARLRVADTRPAPPGREALAALPGATLVCGEFTPALLDGIDVLAISPGLDPRQPIVAAARERGLPVTGEIDLFAHALDQLGWRARCKVVAITGTNGKTTTTALTGALLRAAGLDTEVAGNISPAALDALRIRVERGIAPQAWVLELSSFQLETCEHFAADVAVLLNLSEDHLDRYDGLAEYAKVKGRVFARAAAQVANRDDPQVLALLRASAPVWRFGLDRPVGEREFGLLHRADDDWLAHDEVALLPCSALQLAGRHNAANALAALALCAALGQPTAPLLPALSAFHGLSHRVERVARRADGVCFYDDSKGTNVGATVAALDGLQCPVVLIAGGDGKGQDFTPLVAPVARWARAVVLFGRDAARLQAALASCGVPLLPAADLSQAVALANGAAQPGDAVLLSPACASLDMFRNYAHRAEVFVAAVRALPQVSTA